MEFKDYENYLSPALAKSTDLIMESGKGIYLTDNHGDRYIDFVQGIAVNALGHCYPSLVEAAKKQIDRLIDASFNLVNYPSTLELARQLSEVTPGDLDCVFFSNSGAEANDGAIKLAKAYTKRPAIIAFQGSFHGRTIGCTTITASNAAYRRSYEPMMGGVYFAPYPSVDLCPEGFDAEARSRFCLNELDLLMKYVVAPDQVAGIIVESVQGEGGYVVPPKSFLQGIRERCKEHGIMMICDEVQSGYGRTGKMFACQNFDIVPDIMTVGKAIAGGFPMSAVVSTREIMNEWKPGMHGTTFGGHPVAAAVAVQLLKEYREQNILENVCRMGEYLRSRLNELKKQYPIIWDVRGLGLMDAVEFRHKDGTPGTNIYSKVFTACRENKMLVLGCGVNHNGLRFATPLNITKEELDIGLAIFEIALQAGMKLY